MNPFTRPVRRVLVAHPALSRQLSVIAFSARPPRGIPNGTLGQESAATYDERVSGEAGATRGEDPRWQRTRALLHAAVLRLAAEGPVERITGAALAAEAGVHRSTIYEHGRDPADILREALRAELDEIRERIVEPATDATIVAAISASADEVFAHVDRHAEIYARELRGTTAGLATMLADHFAHSITQLIEHRALVPPPLDDDPGEYATTVAAALAAVAVAVIAVWVQGPEPRDRALLTRRWRAVLPPWWPVTP